jgi:PKD repeat protein
VITIAYLGSGNYFGSTNFLNQIVTNHPPVANPNSYARMGSSPWSIPVTSLLTNASDFDGDTLTPTVGISTNGIMVVIDGGNVLYTNTTPVEDQFTYTVTDGYGGTNSAVITLPVIVPLAPTIQSPYLDGGGANLILRIATQNGFSYILHSATDLNPPVLWSPMATNSGTGGTITNTVLISPVLPAQFFRYLVQ